MYVPSISRVAIEVRVKWGALHNFKCVDYFQVEYHQVKTPAVYQQRQRQRHWRCINKDKDKDTGGVSTTNTTSLSPPSFHTEYHLILSIRGYICIACLLGLKQRLNVQKDDPENTQIMTPRIDRFRRWAHSSNYVNVFDNFPGTMTSMLIRAQSMLSRFKPQRIIRLKSH